MTTARRHTRWVRVGVGVAAVGGLLAGCSHSVGTAVAPSSAPAAASAVGTASAATPAVPAAGGPTAGGSPRQGCAPTAESIPVGAAGVTETADLDHDGAADNLWLADVGDRRLLGVRTASGAVFSTAFTSSAPQRASAIGQELGPDLSIVLLNTGRSVPLYAVVDCHLTPAVNPQGQQYTFDLGFTGFGTGVGCEPARDGSSRSDLYGLLAHQVGDGSWTVTGTRIEFDGSGRTAHNGPSSDLVTGANADAVVIDQARKVTCGNQTNGPTEPQS